MTRASTFALALLSALACAGCGDSGSNPDLDILDPNGVHYGKTYTEWAGEWLAYVTRVAPPDCVSPFMDAAGASCRLYQDPMSPVFFLVGTFGGVARRDQCTVPHGKALFFPLLNISGDNAGVEILYSDEELRTYVESSFTGFLPDSLRLTVDGQSITHLSRGSIASARYTLNLAPDANSYTCAGVPGVQGEFAGYLAGYWALLPALTPGQHTVEFQSASRGPVGVEDTNIDVSYVLSVE